MPDAHYRVLYQGTKGVGSVPSNVSGSADPKSALASTTASIYDEYKAVGGQELESELYNAMDDRSRDTTEEYRKIWV